jgi:hypothetical protein
MREQIGTVRITRARVYQLDPWALSNTNPATVVVEPGEYPVYQNGISRYWRMTGMLNHQYYRIGDGIFAFSGGDVPSDDDVVFYSLRYGPDEWADLLQEFTEDENPALIFSVRPDQG